MSKTPDRSIEHDLAEAVSGLRDEVRVLREAIDDLRTELQHALRNWGNDRWEPVARDRRITSMPRDPGAADFAKRLNTVGPGALPTRKKAPASGARLPVSKPQSDQPPPDDDLTPQEQLFLF